MNERKKNSQIFPVNKVEKKNRFTKEDAIKFWEQEEEEMNKKNAGHPRL